MRNLRYIFIIFYSFCSIVVSAQEMDSENLKLLIEQASDSSEQNGNSIRFIYKERLSVCIFDENANRMRIISPIVERADVGEDELLNAMVANFHSALDVKYALSDEIVWSVLIHPLRELTEHQVIDAIDQVYRAAMTFGTAYSSTDLVFPGNTKKKEKTEHKKLIERQKL